MDDQKEMKKLWIPGNIKESKKKPYEYDEHKNLVEARHVNYFDEAYRQWRYRNYKGFLNE